MFELKSLECGYAHQSRLSIGNKSLAQPLTFVIGPNGSGKSTFLKTLSGILKPVSGSVEFYHHNLTESLPLKQRPAYAPAVPSIQQGVTGLDLLDLLEGHRSPFRESNLEALDCKKFLTLPLNELSSGEAQRVFLAAVLSHPSSVVLLDEPFSHLDWSHTLQLKKLIEEQITQGRSFFISLHDLNWILGFKKSQALVLHNQSLLLDDTAEVALTHPKVQDAFKFNSQIVSNPLDGGKLLALSSYERDRK